MADFIGNCPRDPNIRCCPGPIDGGCCKVIPDRQIGFSVGKRDTHHWDIGTRWGRAFAIRGEPGEIYVRDERDDGRPFPRENIRFRSVATALAWCAEELMRVRSAAGEAGT